MPYFKGGIMKVDILGTEYKLIIATEKERPNLKECDGYIDQSIKEIVVGRFEPEPMILLNLKQYTKKVMRHEIIHAFLYESGLGENSNKIENWAQSEEMVDWIAIQFPKILKAFKEVNAI